MLAGTHSKAISNGRWVPEAIVDTGPLLHLYEIGRLSALTIFKTLLVPGAVNRELERFGVAATLAGLAEVRLDLRDIAEDETRLELEGTNHAIQPADAEVLALARSQRFSQPILTETWTSAMPSSRKVVSRLVRLACYCGPTRWVFWRLMRRAPQWTI